MSKDIQQIRAAIDRLDDQLLHLLNERAKQVQKAGSVKKLDYYRPEREVQILDRLRANNAGPLSNDDIRRIYREIVSVCMALEHSLQLAYLGPAGTFTELALRRQFGDKPQAHPCRTIEGVFREVQNRQCDFGVVPVENSTEGAVGATLDLLLISPLMVCGEIVLPVSYSLLSHAANLKTVQRVYGHPQALAQCQGSLMQRLPWAEQASVVSNSEGARLASEQKDAAALGAEVAAKLYQLPILEHHFEDRPDNRTRFLIVGRQHMEPAGEGRDKTSLICAAPNRAGSMHQLLAPFSRHQVSMTKLESRPSRQSQWSYVFYIDIEGHQQEPKVAAALKEMEEYATFLKILGSYPRDFS